MSKELIKVTCSCSDICKDAKTCSWINEGGSLQKWKDLRERIGKSDGTIVGNCTGHRVVMTPVECGSCISIWPN